MARSNPDSSLSVLGALTLMSGATAALFLLLFWLMQPRALENPGMASYQPPPATRLEPPPRKSDAPELAELPHVNSSSAFAEAYASSEPPALAKPEIRERPKKPAPAKPRRNTDRDKSYAQHQQQQLQQLRQRPQWGFGYGQQRDGSSWSWF
jgi:hypothetical protein